MEFKLNEFHHNVSNQELLDDVTRVAQMLNTRVLYQSQYKKYGKYSPSTIGRRFGSWTKALDNVGLLSVRGGKLKNINNINVTDEQLLDDLQATAKALNVISITTTQYKKYGKHGAYIIIERFGTWEKALLKAGLEPTGFRASVSIEELLEDLEKTWIKLGRQPTTSDIKKGESRFSLNSYTRKFGSWRKALEFFVNYINSDEQHETISDHAQSKCNISTNENISLNETHKTSRDINLRLRFLVMKRDNFKCRICGRSPATTPGLELHIDHIKPWSKGGETEIDNLQTLCQDCNLGKSNLE
ncbi:MAG TPA: HNH endonuclease [Candidatus Gallimonas intestinavium]|uniref:HNH endonuclease n=1 Tax=Candidatus Gallimonas intestinavium TaxID=2838603 RepID=A0A9D2G458_9FIRM|nr:HNH endonuclease [Candidatus Gallimonas intestinavium]